ncbi:MAG: YcxB family protein [Anaerolineales bacterium]
MIQIKGQYSLDDFKKAQQLHARQAAASAGERIAIVLLAVFFYISLAILVALGRLHWAYLVVPLVLLAVFLLFQYIYRPFMLARTFNRNKDLSEPFEMELSDEGVSTSNLRGNALIPWESFVKWAEGPEMILLYRTYIMFQMVPKRLFATESDLQYLREQLTRNHIPEAGKPAKPAPLSRYLVYIILFLAIIAMLYINIK